MKLFLSVQIYPVSLYMATIFKMLIPDVTRFCYPQVRFPMTRFWKVCTRCEYESLIDSKQYWQCTNKKSIKIANVIQSQDRTQEAVVVQLVEFPVPQRTNNVAEELNQLVPQDSSPGTSWRNWLRSFFCSSWTSWIWLSWCPCTCVHNDVSAHQTRAFRQPAQQIRA